MGDDTRERFRRRLQRYRQHHEASCCRYDNHINNITEQQQQQTRLLHKRWLESKYSDSGKRLKLGEGTVASSNTAKSSVRKLAFLLTCNYRVTIFSQAKKNKNYRRLHRIDQ